MTQSMIRRTLKNLVQNYSEAEVKVREATSNDPWGPSSSQMADISDLTYNVVACGEIMGMLWKRLNDDKNWRHVYKSLTLLEYLLKTGSERIPKQSQENIHIIKPLLEFRFIDKDGKDQGVNVREKAKMVLALIQDEEKRKEERECAMKTKDKLASGTSDSSDKAKAEVPAYTGLPSLDNIPSVADLTASMAKKKEEQRRLEEERKETERRAKEGEKEPDLWEQAAPKAVPSSSDPWGAPSGVQKGTGCASSDPWGAPSSDSKDSGPVSVDPWGGLVDGKKDSATASGDPWGGSAMAEKQSPPAQNEPWGDTAQPTENKDPASTDPWGTSSDLLEDSQQTKADPWGTLPQPPTAKLDPWGGDGGISAVSTTDPFGDGAKVDNPWGTSGSSPLSANDPWGAPPAPNNTTVDPFGNGGISDSWTAPTESRTNGTGDLASAVPPEDSKKPPSFLGEGASLVDLDSLMSVKPKQKQLPLSALSASGQKAQGKEG
ncbi:hypothetical protein P4O66_019665 [Electrophorus voltai]|uniref:ENTH domain-containing protein n=1 Tax=Electrophorus voltai TaxID=2609070 RepID=A0AAD8ZUY5_9TELE|nr:hypothetical protein P4O66_019665 [Electrophorus voltai]